MVGYSFDANIIPFIVNRLPEYLKNRLAGVDLLSPEEYGDFEIHVLDMLDLRQNKEGYNVVEETKKALALKPVCFFKSERPNTTMKHFMKEGIETVVLPGNHHFNDNHRLIVASILKTGMR